MIQVPLEPAARLRVLIRLEGLRLCRLLDVSDFVRYANERGVNTDEERLERLDRLGVFRPMIRVRRPWVREKLRELPSGQTEVIGLLEDGEVWDGPSREGFARFGQDRETLEWYHEHGHLWHPASREHVPWNCHVRDEFHRPIELALYSRFQVSDLERRQSPLTVQIHLDGFEGERADSYERLGENLSKYLGSQLEFLRSHPYDDALPFLAQALASRYYPQTQGDRRTITVSAPLEADQWDWWEYARTWDARAHAAELGMTGETIQEYVSHVQRVAQWADPLEAWYDLVQFVRVDERARLKGDARRAQDLYAMEHMARLFHADLTGAALPPPDEDRSWTRDSLYGAGTTADTLAHLECVANRYNLNPRPRLLLVVEGKGEAEQFPRILLDLLGQSPTTLGIEIRPLWGVGEFVGRRLERCGALEKLVDDHHHRGTVVIVVLDREGGVSRIADRLRQARSRLNPSRTLTRPEYVHLWERNIEFDNFSHEEVARGLETVSEGRAAFSASDVADAMAAYDEGRADPLSALYDSRLNYGLQKVELLRVLVGSIVSNGRAEFDDKGCGRRPVVRILQEVARLAATNVFPMTRESWEDGQTSGFFGLPT